MMQNKLKDKDAAACKARSVYVCTLEQNKRNNCDILYINKYILFILITSYNNNIANKSVYMYRIK